MYNYQKKEYQEFAQIHFKKHRLDLLGWTFGFDRAKRRLGICKTGSRHISISEPYCEILDRQEIQDTILHEIAHALAGPGENHSYKWKKCAIRVGARPLQYYSGATRVAHTWETSCVKCGRVTAKTHKRRSAKVLMHRVCPCGGNVEQKKV